MPSIKAASFALSTGTITFFTPTSFSPKTNGSMPAIGLIKPSSANSPINA